MQKLEEKIEDWDSSLSAQDRLSVSSCLAVSPSLVQRRPMKNPKGMLSVMSQPILWRGCEKAKIIGQSVCLQGRKRAVSPPTFI